MNGGLRTGDGKASRQTPPTPTAEGRAFASAWRRERLSVDERVARGAVARAVVPRSSHARFEPAPDRPDPIELLEEQAAPG